MHRIRILPRGVTDRTVVAAINKSGHKLTLDSTPVMIISTLVSFVLTQNVAGSNLKFHASRAEWSKIIASVRQIAILLQHKPKDKATQGEQAEHAKIVGNAMKLLKYFPKALQEGLEGRASEGFSTARRASVKLQQACGKKDEDIVLPPVEAPASQLNDKTGADDYADTDVARQILTWLSGYINKLARLEHIKAPLQSLALQSVSNLQNAASSLHRAATTSSPAPYTFHLKVSIWAFLVFLPFQQYSTLGWWVIAVEFAVALVYLGFIQVGVVVANPFTPGTGKDGKALLPMDQMTGRIEAQLEKITGFNIDHILQDLDLDLPEAPDMQRIMAVIEREAQNRARAAQAAQREPQPQQAPQQLQQPQRVVVPMLQQGIEPQRLDTDNRADADDAVSEKHGDELDEAEAAPRHAFERDNGGEGSVSVVPTVVLR